MIANEFQSTLIKHGADHHQAVTLWEEISRYYSERKRYYHNLNHLGNMLSELNAVRDQINDWDTLVVALAWHDVIYSSTAKDNEEKSAEFAAQRMTKLSFSQEQISRCRKMILATKGHSISDDNDTNLLTDADLSILGKSWEVYDEYFRNVRKEYKIYPDLLYRPGRKKVLQHFLSMPRIFKTSHFYSLYEFTSRDNLKREFELL